MQGFPLFPYLRDSALSSKIAPYIVDTLNTQPLKSNELFKLGSLKEVSNWFTLAKVNMG